MPLFKKIRTMCNAKTVNHCGDDNSSVSNLDHVIYNMLYLLGHEVV